jgi:hypothetical protein
MDWEPIAETRLWDLIIAAEQRMAPHIFRLWEAIKISPEKWSEKRYGAGGNGFWVVAIIGGKVIWYNDIEDGFNLSSYCVMGKIADYVCNQDELELAVQHVLNMFDPGQDFSARSGPQALAAG